MADQKISQLTALTDPAAGDLLALVDDPTGTPVTKKITLSHARKFLSASHNVLDYGAVGDAIYTDGSGTNDTAAFQAAIDAAVVDGVGFGQVIIPGNRNYRINSTITVPFGVQILGVGGRMGSGSAGGPRLVWNGSAGGTMLDCAEPLVNIPSTSIRNVTLAGRNDDTNLPATLLKFRGTGGFNAKLDTGTYIENVWFIKYSGDALRLEGGSAGGSITNFFIRGCRWDDLFAGAGYGIYVNVGQGCTARFMIDGHCTWASAGGEGFLYLDGEAATTESESAVEIYSLHTEVGTDLVETYAGGTNPYDKRGVIRLGVASAIANVQHRIRVFGYKHAWPAGIASHSIFQVTASGGTDDANSRMVSIMVMGGDDMNIGTTDSNATNRIGFIGGRVPYTERPPSGVGRSGIMMFAIGKQSSTEHVQSWINTRDFTVRGFIPHATAVADLPAIVTGNPIATVTDATATTRGSTVAGGGANNVLVRYDGANWIIV